MDLLGVGQQVSKSSFVVWLAGLKSVAHGLTWAPPLWILENAGAGITISAREVSTEKLIKPCLWHLQGSAEC